ncbi:ankyrin [Coniochaeta ligniaria NRRL 30616]|uniref:Ankyrin n=1 Tax=Coniochaeta ligniaria NRRL 30616 TaxID=1408157 RepID=A0A1J7J9Z6_9PEZI|nr:ankyrin [Coniochaeta ligniaria NRRL 30616]
MGRTALIHAASVPSVAIVKLLVEKGADIEAKDAWGHTALYVAAAANDGLGNVAALLLEEGANIETRDQYGLTSLINATQLGHHATMLQLLEKGADVNSRDQKGWSALTYAVFVLDGYSVLVLVHNRAQIEFGDIEELQSSMIIVFDKGLYETKVEPIVRLILRELSDREHAEWIKLISDRELAVASLHWEASGNMSLGNDSERPTDARNVSHSHTHANHSDPSESTQQQLI